MPLEDRPSIGSIECFCIHAEEKEREREGQVQGVTGGFRAKVYTYYYYFKMESQCMLDFPLRGANRLQ